MSSWILSPVVIQSILLNNIDCRSFPSIIRHSYRHWNNWGFARGRDRIVNALTDLQIILTFDLINLLNEDIFSLDSIDIPLTKFH